MRKLGKSPKFLENLIINIENEPKLIKIKMPRILSIMMNILYVVEGYVKWLWDLLFKHASNRTKQRLELCNKCTENNNGICDLCGCVIKAKVRCTFLEDENGKTIDGCPLKKW